VDLLARLVVAPLALPEDVRRVLVSPAGALGYVPFALLLPEREVAYVPSGTTYGLLRAERERRGEGVLALGDPDYGRVGDEVVAARHRGGIALRLSRLEATRPEAEAVGTLRLLGEDATEAGLRSALETSERWRAVHFACHGLLDPEQPMFSSLALTAAGEDDGFLTALEILQLPMHADLVVMSACETGKGKVYKIEGIVGLTQALMFAGAPRVVCSLWKVDDVATRTLMVRFYELWNPKEGTGLAPAAALREAQRFVRESPAHPEWRHPFYWAAWVLWGLPD
jgi:CHAT domain-containing protein